MRRIAGATLAMLCCLCMALTACQGQVKPAPYTTGQVDLIADSGAFSETLEPLDGDTAFGLYHLADYGLSRDDLTDCAILRSAGATCEEVAVLVLTEDEDKISSAQQALTDYVQQQLEENRDYRPGEIHKLEDALVDRRGAALLLVVANDLEKAKDAVA